MSSKWLVIGLLCRLSASASAAEVTFNKHIAPLVFQHCAKCHRPGEVAPFSLLLYDDVAKRADLVADVVARHAMPPWKPVTAHGEFANGRRLTSDEINVFRRWADAGAPEGGASDRPSPPKFAEGWQLGPPDVVLAMPEAAQIPADGRDVYLNVILPLQVPAGKYLRAAEFHPGNRRVVHHAVLFMDTGGKARERDEAEPGLGFHAVSPPGKFLPGTLAIWTPGRNPLPLADGLSLPWPANADLVLNLHLHPSGKPETEQSSVGIYFTDEPPKRSLVDVTLIDRKIDIAPGEKAFRTHDECTLPVDMDLLSIFPHMHIIGKEMRLTATLPDGKTRSLFWIDDWDFNWQDVYEYAEPVRLPKGTKIALDGVHDNSADNPQNPRHPPERVRWGEQTFNEMSIAFLNLAPARESDLGALPTSIDRHISLAIKPAGTKLGSVASKGSTPADFAERAADALRKADKDGNGRLSLAEVKAAVGNRQPPEVLEKQLVRFDRDGDRELNRAEVAEALKALAK